MMKKSKCCGREAFSDTPPCPKCKTHGMPLIVWACEGGTGANGKIGLTVDSLESKLNAGMSNDEIERMAETKQGNAVIDKYISKKAKEGRHIEEMTDGLFNRKLPNGDLCRNHQFDQKTGKQVPVEV